MRLIGRWQQSARWGLALAAILAALWKLSGLLPEVSPGQLATAWHKIPLGALGWSLTATATSFAFLAGYEWFASQQVAPGRIPTLTALRVGAITHAISNTLGFHALTASVLRYHLYRPQALGIADVGRLMAMVAACLAAGVMATMGLAVAWLKAGVPGLVIAMGLLLLLAWGLSAAMRHVRLWPAWPRIDPTRMVGVLMVGVLETVAALAALYVLLPDNVGTTLVQFVPIFIGATLLGIVSHSPGGVGVFEAAILAMLPGHPAALLASLLCHRVIYNLLPFAASSVLAIVALHEQRKDSVRRRISPDGALLVEVQTR
jgi:uncharacterized membrane protein YbhN (UPF0104 family)